MLVKLWIYKVFWTFDIKQVCIYVCVQARPLVYAYLELTKKMICSSSKKSLKNKAYYFLVGAEFPIQYLVQSITEKEAKLHIVIGLEQHHSCL